MAEEVETGASGKSAVRIVCCSDPLGLFLRTKAKTQTHCHLIWATDAQSVDGRQVSAAYTAGAERVEQLRVLIQGHFDDCNMQFAI